MMRRHGAPRTLLQDPPAPDRPQRCSFQGVDGTARRLARERQARHRVHAEPLQERVRAVLGGEPAWKEVEKRIRVFQPERRTALTEYFGVVATAVLKRS